MATTDKPLVPKAENLTVEIALKNAGVYTVPHGRTATACAPMKLTFAKPAHPDLFVNPMVQCVRNHNNQNLKHNSNVHVRTVKPLPIAVELIEIDVRAVMLVSN
jgi:hypothetical protein|tara:strand:- start:268 stop:579 length:312 start_codon:yes stop_codon:yes gene_type:complete